MAKYNDNVFITLAPWSKNVDLCKDVGRIPYYFHKKYGFKSIIVLSKNKLLIIFYSVINIFVF